MFISSGLAGAFLGVLSSGMLPASAAFGAAANPGLATSIGADSRQVGVSIWVENHRDYYRMGDRLDVRFTVSDDAYIGIVHIDTDGNLDFVYPASPWDNEWVRGGRVHSVALRGNSSFAVRGGAGIGYFYIVASPTPLDFSYFRGRGSSPWEWGYAGRVVQGDPFLAMDQVTRLLVPRWPYSPFVANYYSYYVGGIHRYPTYACSDRYVGGGWGWSPAFGSCTGMEFFLRQNPYYYDTRRYVGDRRSYLRQYDSLDPRHGFKEVPNQPARGLPSATPRQDLRGATPPAAPAPREGTATPRREPAGAAPQRAPQPPPATGRQPVEPSGGASRGTAAPAPGTRAPAPEPASAPARRPVPDDS
jgi:hypothetical protein